MKEFFIRANSFAAPFFSDTWDEYVQAETAEAALTKFAKECSHPAGLYSANAYDSADDFHKGKKSLAQWLCNHEAEKQRLTKSLGSYSYLGHEPGRFEINGELHIAEKPKEGKVVATP